MAAPYMTHQTWSELPQYPCRRHAVRWFGVFDAHINLVAYAVIYRSGELALISQILGHADHLKNEIMFLLMQGVLRTENDLDPHGYLVYNRHDSGRDGLREFKEHFGFEPMGVEWLA